MEFANRIKQRIKDRIVIIYILIVVFITLLFFLLIYPNENEQLNADKNAVEELRELCEVNSEKGNKILERLLNDEKQKFNISLFRSMSAQLSKGFIMSDMGIPSSFRQIRNISDTSIYVVGRIEDYFIDDNVLIMKLKNDGGWVEEEGGYQGYGALNGIWGDDTSVYVVGFKGDKYVNNEGLIVKKQSNGSWEEEVIESENFGPLNNLWGNDTSIYAVGYNSSLGKDGLIVKYKKNGNWKEEEIKGKDIKELFGIWGDSKSVYAVGIKNAINSKPAGLILKLDKDGTWKERDIENGEMLTLLAIWSDNKDAYAVGYRGDVRDPVGIILKRQEDDTWKVDAEERNITLYGVWGDGRNVFAVGYKYTSGSFEGVILKREENGLWKEEEIEGRNNMKLYGISGTSKKIYAVGEGGELSSRQGIILNRSDGGKWIKTPLSKLIQWDKLKIDEANIGVRYDILAIFLVGFFTLSVVGYTILPRKENTIRDSQEYDKELKADKNPKMCTLEKTIIESKDIVRSMLIRANVLLAFGIGMALLGVFLFYYLVEKVEPLEKDYWENFFEVFKSAGILIFIEGVAFFFLRQYREVLKDYKFFYNIYLIRSNYDVAERYIRNENLSLDDKRYYLKKLLDGQFIELVDSFYKQKSQSKNDPAFQKIIQELINRLPKEEGPKNKHKILSS